MLKRSKIYIAAPLFNQMEREFNKHLAELVEEVLDVFLPQRDGGLLVDLVRKGVSPNVAEKIVFEKDIAAIEDCDGVVAVLDGANVDEGVAFELGFAFARGKPCFGLQTDMRRQLPTGNNPMLSASLCAVYSTAADLVQGLTLFTEKQTQFPARVTSSYEHQSK